MVKVLEDGKDVTKEVPEENRVDCTMRLFGWERKFYGKLVGTEITKTYTDWNRPAVVTLRRIG